jgi:hypothetical protein
MFCFHKYGKVEDGYQYCKKCGKAIVIPCDHKWKHIENAQFEFDVLPTKVIKILQCKNCGEMKNFRIG